MSDWDFFELSKIPNTLNRKKFYCRIDFLNKFLWEYPAKNEQKSLTKVYVIVYKEDNLIAGYYSLNTTLFQGFKGSSFKVIQIKKLAVHDGVIGMNVSELLLIDALEKIYKISSYYHDISAVEGCVVHDSIIDFYKKFGFKFLGENKTRMIMPMKIVNNIFQINESINEKNRSKF